MPNRSATLPTPRTLWRTLNFPALALGLASLLPIPAVAQIGRDDWRDRSNWNTVLDGRLVDVQVQVDGADAPLYLSPRWADQRRYFEAFAGRNYSIVLSNKTSRRIGVLVAVDGLNVVNGSKSRLALGEPMYVMDPYERAEIRGWRTSLDNVRRFVFVDEQRSYAERTGQANGDMGWIRVLSFQEQRSWWNLHGDRRNGGWRGPGALDQERKSAPEAGSPQGDEVQRQPGEPQSSAEKPLGKSSRLHGQAKGKDADGPFPGTGWGDRRYDPVRETRFTADGPAVDHLVLRYEYQSGLLALGIEPQRAWPHERLRQRDSELGFARPPRW
jgi:hypothetical protein